MNLLECPLNDSWCYVGLNWVLWSQISGKKDHKFIWYQMREIRGNYPPSSGIIPTAN